MRDQDLRDGLLDSARSWLSLPAPGLEVLRRRVRRRRIRIGAATLALSIVAGGGAAAAISMPDMASQHPATGPSQSASATPQASGTPTVAVVPPPQGWSRAGPALAPDASVAAAPYFVTLDSAYYYGINFSGYSSAVVADAFTGKALAAVPVPAGMDQAFSAVAAAGDDRTFFLASPLSVVSLATPAPSSAFSYAIYELRLGADGKPVSITRAYTAQHTSSLNVLAVSADATRLAYVTSTGIEVVSLPAGTSRLVAAPSTDIEGMSWVGDRKLAVVLRAGPSAGRATLLMVNVEPGPVPPSSPVLSATGTFGFALIAPDASTVFATMDTGAGQGDPLSAVEEFSGRTGRLIARLTPWVNESGMGSSCQPLWTDSSGTNGVVECGGVFTFTGSRASRADLHVPSANFSTAPNWLIAW